MRTILVSALALGAMTSVAFAAEPAKAPVDQNKRVVLTTAQMDGVTAGTHRGGHGLIRVGDVCVGVVVGNNTGSQNC